MIMSKYELKKRMIRLGDDYLATLWNDWCEEMHYYGDEIYSMDEFNKRLNGRTPIDIASLAFYGEFNPSDSYFSFDGYGNLASFDILIGEQISGHVQDYHDFEEMFDAIYHGEFLPAIYDYVYGREEE